MIASTNPYAINLVQSDSWRQNFQDNLAVDQDFQSVLNQSTEEQEAKDAGGSSAQTIADNAHSELVTFLNALIGGAEATSVNEEQLFASIIYDRISSVKGESLANEYDALLETKMAEHTRADGFIYVEEAARAALKELESSGKLTTEEAETIHAQAFQAAQLDDNTSVLWDSRGTTMSVAPTATAMEKVLAMLLKFDSGELDSGRMSLSYQQDQSSDEAAAASAATAASGSASGTSAAGSSGGYTESATYTSYGVRNGGRQAWRIPESGPDFGSKLKVVFEDGHTVYVNDTSQNYRESDGFVFKPGIGPNGEGSENTGTAHGGVYLHAPYGNSSKKATFYWYG
jgi:hypothetical protein